MRHTQSVRIAIIFIAVFSVFLIVLALFFQLKGMSPFPGAQKIDAEESEGPALLQTPVVSSEESSSAGVWKEVKEDFVTLAMPADWSVAYLDSDSISTALYTSPKEEKTEHHSYLAFTTYDVHADSFCFQVKYGRDCTSEERMVIVRDWRVSQHERSLQQLLDNQCSLSGKIFFGDKTEEHQGDYYYCANGMVRIEIDEGEVFHALVIVPGAFNIPKQAIIPTFLKNASFTE